MALRANQIQRNFICLLMLAAAAALFACPPGGQVPGQPGTGSNDDDDEPQPVDSDGDGLPDSDDPCPDDIGNDNDNDGVCASEGDCDDDNESRAPGLQELCDGIDNNCSGTVDDGAPCTEINCNNSFDDDSDGAIDCDDSDCATDPACVIGPENCDNGIDDDRDASYDCLDSDCSNDPACNGLSSAIEQGGAQCSDGVDNDGDGFVDCADFSCIFDAAMEGMCGINEENTNAECVDGVDNDGDGFIDCADYSCQNQRNWLVSACVSSESIEGACNDGVDNDGDGLIDCADSQCGGAQVCGGPGIPESNDSACVDGLDNDFDGIFDCADPGCTNVASCNLSLNVMINEIGADPDPDPTVGDWNCDNLRDAASDEFVELFNYGNTVANMTGIELHDGIGVRHIFPPGTLLAVGGSVVVFGENTPTFDGSSINPSPWCVNLPADVLVQVASEGAGLGLNNGGDTVSLVLGGQSLTEVTYGPEGGNNESLVRDPEGSPTAGFIRHTTAAASVGPASPGTRADGSPL